MHGIRIEFTLRMYLWHWCFPDQEIKIHHRISNTIYITLVHIHSRGQWKFRYFQHFKQIFWQILNLRYQYKLLCLMHVHHYMYVNNVEFKHLLFCWLLPSWNIASFMKMYFFIYYTCSTKEEKWRVCSQKKEICWRMSFLQDRPSDGFQRQSISKNLSMLK